MIKINTDPKKIEEILTRSIDSVYPSKNDFEKLLKSGKQLRIYMGIDPTATYVHLGHATNYIILKKLHDLGHKVIVLIGDFTAMIGDPSDKGSARKRLTKEEVFKNLKTFKKQIGEILDFDNQKNPIEFRFNSEWLSKLKFDGLLELASCLTVQRMLERDIFQKRLKEEKPLYVHEFFYPLMQGYDSVALQADVEIGGTDQTFNMLVGRDFVKRFLEKEKIVVTTTLLENPKTGEKLMSKSLGTGIGLDEDANNMYGKVMALPDEAIIQVFTDCTFLPMEEIKKIDLKKENPRDIKARLAKEIVALYHSEKAALAAEAEFNAIFRDKGKPSAMPEIKAPLKKVKIIDFLVENKLASSKSEARRLIEQNGVKLNDIKISNIEAEEKLKSGDIIQVGKRRFAKIV